MTLAELIERASMAAERIYGIKGYGHRDGDTAYNESMVVKALIDQCPYTTEHDALTIVRTIQALDGVPFNK